MHLASGSVGRWCPATEGLGYNCNISKSYHKRVTLKTSPTPFQAPGKVAITPGQLPLLLLQPSAHISLPDPAGSTWWQGGLVAGAPLQSLPLPEGL